VDEHSGVWRNLHPELSGVKNVYADDPQPKEIICRVNSDVFQFALQLRDGYLVLSIRRLCGAGIVRARDLFSPEISRPAQPLLQTEFWLPSENGLRL
jgi:hypothetical protein